MIPPHAGDPDDHAEMPEWMPGSPNPAESPGLSNSCSGAALSELVLPGVAGAVVTPHGSRPGVVELVGYYTLRADTPGIDEEQIRSWLRDRLPPH